MGQITDTTITSKPIRKFLYTHKFKEAAEDLISLLSLRFTRGDIEEFLSDGEQKYLHYFSLEAFFEKNNMREFFTNDEMFELLRPTSAKKLVKLLFTDYLKESCSTIGDIFKVLKEISQRKAAANLKLSLNGKTTLLQIHDYLAELLTTLSVEKKDFSSFLTFETDSFIFNTMKNNIELINFAKTMKNCVASYEQGIHDKTHRIWKIYDKKSNQYYCAQTDYIKLDTIKQIKAKCNNPVPQTTLKPLKKDLQQFNQTIISSKK